MYQFVTMTHYFDSLFRNRIRNMMFGKPILKNCTLLSSIGLGIADVASAKGFGPTAGGEELGAFVHYMRHGQYEGRVWQESSLSGNSAPPLVFAAPRAKWRQIIMEKGMKFDGILLSFGLLALLFQLFLLKGKSANPLLLTVSVFLLFSGARTLALSYVSVYMGYLDYRLFFQTYVLLALFGGSWWWNGEQYNIFSSGAKKK